VVDVGPHIDLLVLKVTESYELCHGVPIPVLLDPPADLSVSCIWPFEELQDSGVKREDESIVVVVVAMHQQDHKFLSKFLALLSAFRVVNKRK
jgi:hypothetical protein